MTSAVVAALLAVLLSLAPVTDFANVERSTGQQTTIISAHLAPPYAVLAAARAVRQSWISDKTKQKSVHAMAGTLSPRIDESCCGHPVQLDLVPRLEPGQFLVISDRSPPDRTSRA